MNSCSYFNFTENRRLGIRFKGKSRPRVVSQSLLRTRLYKDIIPKESVAFQNPNFPTTENYMINDNTPDVGGGIFNLDFSPDSKLLGAACERKSVLLFDPISRSLISEVSNAHEDCVNCIRFLDNRLFATCSDDTTVGLWDARYLKKKLHSMRGHSNWVKNIEFSTKDNYLVTSGFDGAIFAWDINNFHEGNDEATNIFYTGGLMRMRLTPTGDKMVISTINGYLIIIHDLCLDTLAKDLSGFKPNMYRLLQMSGNPLRVALNSTPLFHAKRNRVELVSDFAPGNEPDIVSSLQIHPQGWVAVSRNVSSDQSTEWCCVHDIQSYPVNPEDDQDVSEKRPDQSPVIPRHESRRHSGFMMLAELLQAGNPIIVPPHPDEILQRPIPPLSRSENAPAAQASSPEDNSENNPNGAGANNQEVAANPSDEFQIRNRSSRINEFLQLLSRAANRPSQQGASGSNEADQPSSSGRSAQAEANESNRNNEESSDNSTDEEQNQGFLVIPSDPTTGSRPRFFSFVTQRSPTRRRRQQQRRRPPTESTSSSEGSTSAANSQSLPENAKIHHNIKRLTHYIQESNSNEGRGFIKEVSFSSDGILLASPYDSGVRLLAFNNQLDDLSFCAPKSLDDPPRELHVVGTISNCHKEVVLSTAFSPHRFLLVTGCRGGSLGWHCPRL